MNAHLHEDTLAGRRLTVAVGHAPQSLREGGRWATAVRLRRGLREARARCVATAEGLAWYTEAPAMVPALQTLSWPALQGRCLVCWPLDRGVLLFTLGEMGFNLPSTETEMVVSVEQAIARLESCADPVVVLPGGDAGRLLESAGWLVTDQETMHLAAERGGWTQPAFSAFSRRGLPHGGHAVVLAALLLLVGGGYWMTTTEDMDVVQATVKTVVGPPTGVASLRGDIDVLRDAIPLLRRLGVLGLTGAEYRDGELTASGVLEIDGLARLVRAADSAGLPRPAIRADGWEWVLPTGRTAAPSQLLAPVEAEVDRLVAAARGAGWGIAMTGYDRGASGRWASLDLELSAATAANLHALSARLAALAHVPSARLTGARVQVAPRGWSITLNVTVRGRTGENSA